MEEREALELYAAYSTANKLHGDSDTTPEDIFAEAQAHQLQVEEVLKLIDMHGRLGRAMEKYRCDGLN
jgi:hypothetical protein